MLEIIGFCGIARSGKNTAAEYLAKLLEKYDGRESEFVGFADELKSHLSPLVKMCKKNGIDTHSSEFKEKFRPMWVEWSRVLKELTNNKQIWVDLAWDRIQNICIYNGNVCMITDVRYDYEIDFIINHGGTIIFLERPDTYVPNDEEAESFKKIYETYKDMIKDFKIINDSTKEELGERCYKLLQEHDLI